MLEKKWIIKELDLGTLSTEADSSLKVTPFILSLLSLRGIREKKMVKEFLYPEIYQPFHDPFLLKGMHSAVERIKKAIFAHEKIIVYGDYDVDGITASTILTKNLQKMGAKVETYIPARLTEGYGLHDESLQKLIKNGVELLITVDCGISAAREVAKVRGKLDIIITDHHLPPQVLPECIAVINPHQKDCSYPFKDLAGVGVAFKLLQALYEEIMEENFTGDLELVALGTVADMVPLLDENRKIVKLGLSMMENTEIIGLKALLNIAEVTFPLSTGDIGFKLAPRLNAAGRLKYAQKGVDLLLATDKDYAEHVAEELNIENENRRNLEQEILREASVRAEKLQAEEKSGFVIAGDKWHAGVIGIVASRIVDRFYRPTVIISVENGIGKGSCRSIGGFNMYEALSSCKECLEVFGGHEMAAGLTVKEENIHRFSEMFNNYAKENILEEDYFPKIHLECKLELEDINLDLVNELKLLEPYGQKNPRPLFYTQGVEGKNIRIVGKDENHLLFMAHKNNSVQKVVAWNLADEKDKLKDKVDLAFSPEINEYLGLQSVQLKLLDLKVSDKDTLCPSKEELGILYQELRKRQANLKKESMFLDVNDLERSTKIKAPLIKIALKIFQELVLLKGDDEKGYTLIIPKQKLNLLDSPTYKVRQK